MVTVNGNPICYFKNTINEPLQSCKVYFAATQEGSGDPSPSNVRAITGVSSVQVSAMEDLHVLIPDGTTWTANGLVVDHLGNGLYHMYGNVPSSGTIAKIKLKEPFTIRAASETDSGRGRLWLNNSIARGNFYLYSGSDGSTSIDSWSMSPANRQAWNYSAMANKTMTHFGLYGSTGTCDYYVQPMFFAQKRYTTTFPSTMYKGQIDLINGELTVTHSFVEYDGSEDENWSVQTWSGVQNFYIKIEDAKGKQGATLLCNRLPLSTSNDAQVGKVGISSGKYLNCAVGSLINISDLSNFKTWLSENPLQIVYELATPLTYQLTPIQINSYKGLNYVWSGNNSDIYDRNIEIEYNLHESADIMQCKKRIYSYCQSRMIGGLPVLIDNASYGSGNNAYNSYTSVNDYFITGWFDTGDSSSKSYTYPYMRIVNNTPCNIRLFNDKTATSYDYWGAGTVHEDYLENHTTRTITSGGRYIACSVYKPTAADFYIYDNTNQRYICKGKNVT